MQDVHEVVLTKYAHFLVRPATLARDRYRVGLVPDVLKSSPVMLTDARETTSPE